jgi:putative PIN family toxin of toxin-antitoxin system
LKTRPQVIAAVFDCNVLISGIGWPGNPRSCLNLVGTGKVLLCVTNAILHEYHGKVIAVLKETRPEIDPRPTLDWLLPGVHIVEPAPLGKLHSRDAKDDRHLACALAAGAQAIVTNDRDLLALGKPYGIAILTPIEFLKFAQGQTML